MKSKKIYIITITILILIIVLQIVYNMRKNYIKYHDAGTQNEIPPIETYADEIVINNIDEVLNNYNGEISEEKLRNSINNLALSTIYTIKHETKDKSISENEEYYYKNEIKVNNMGIRTKEDFMLIAEEISNFAKDNYFMFNNAELNTIDDSDISDGYYKLYLTLKYSNDTTINLKCYLSINDDTIMYLSNSQIAQLYEKYGGTVEKIELLETISNFANNAKWIRENTKLVSINKQLQFYSDNEQTFNSMGIVSKEDFQSISTEMSNNISWTDSTELNYYIIDLINYDKQEQYDSFKITFIYDYSEQLPIEIYLSNSNRINPSIRFVGINEE